MIPRLRVALLLLRPPVAMLLALFALLGLSRAHASGQAWPTLSTAAVIGGFLLFSVAVNDLADAQIDRVNLPGDRRRPLVQAGTPRGDLVMLGVLGALVAVAVSIVLGPRMLLLILAGLVISAAYSLRPIRLCDRGAVATLVLPSCYVAVPYLTAFAAASRTPRIEDMLLLAGLYVAFLGRIVLKDFRDVVGDAMFGKRTFLLRHGQATTCRFSAVMWLAGTIVLLIACLPTDPADPGFDFTMLTLSGVALCLLRLLADEPDPRRQDRLISAIAILGRGSLLTLLAENELLRSAWPMTLAWAVLGLLGAITAWQSALMVRYGPQHRARHMNRHPADCAVEFAVVVDDLH